MIRVTIEVDMKDGAVVGLGEAEEHAYNLLNAVLEEDDAITNYDVVSVQKL